MVLGFVCARVCKYTCLQLSSKSWVGRDLQSPLTPLLASQHLNSSRWDTPWGREFQSTILVALLVLNKTGDSRYENLLDPGYANPSLGDWGGGGEQDGSRREHLWVYLGC